MHLQTIKIPFDNPYEIELFIRREDLIHPLISGNKFRKLKYNLQYAIENGIRGVLSFGGAYSNHIAALSAAGKLNGIKTVGVIRGDELSNSFFSNPTLAFAFSQGMEFDFVSREDYRRKNTSEFMAYLEQKYPGYYIIPEGGSNMLAVKGCEEILLEDDDVYDYVVAPVGTGGTLAGLIRSSRMHQTIVGVPVLKGDFLNNDIRMFVGEKVFVLFEEYNFGGYAKVNDHLINFINDFTDSYGVPLDPIYTGKMMFAIKDQILKGYFKPKSKVLAIHTGGLQGIEGANKELVKRGKQIIKLHV